MRCRTEPGEQRADVRGPGDRGAGHDRAAGGRRGRGAGAQAWPAEGGAAPVQTGHARGAQAAVDQHEAHERVQGRRGRRLVVAVRPRRRRWTRGRRHGRRSRRPRVRGQRQLVRVPRTVQAVAVHQEPRLRADHVPVQEEGRVVVRRAHHQQEQRIHR